MMKRIFVMAMAATMSFACSKDPNGLDQGKTDGGAFLALSLTGPAVGGPVNAPASKAGTNTSTPGSQIESTMGTATVLLFDDNLTCLGSVEFAKFVSGNQESKEVSEKTTKIFVAINNLAAIWDLSNSLVVGRSWEVINPFVIVEGTALSASNKFVMTNAGDNTKGALIDVTVHKSAAEAQAAPAAVVVDRLVAKVTVKAETPTATNATFIFNGWELNTTNKSSRLYTDRITYNNATTSAVAGIYRKDNNYAKVDFPTDETALTAYLKANYNWLSNGTSMADMSPVTNPNGSFAYCNENTMDADAQLWGHTTKIVVKGQYTPTTDEMGTTLAVRDSYFKWGGLYFSKGNIKAAYQMANYSALKTDLITFLVLADDTFKALSADDQKLEAHIDGALARLDNYSGIKAKYQAVQYFHESVCFYDASIRHDASIDTEMALGRYGVVRNNSYEIKVTSVKGPGTPWIPDPTNPADPTKPDEPDDSVPANLSITVTVNPWTHWVHNVELGS